MNTLGLINRLENIMVVSGVAVILIIIALFLWVFTFSRAVLKTQNHQASMKGFNFLLVFIVYFLLGVGIISLLLYGAQQVGGTFNNLLFVVLPYLCLLVFIIGSIYRYRTNGFQVSSLSSQFLEGRKLFWGSQLFHWGILFLFFGHLIAFLLPGSVIAWNGDPLRLMILEASAFAFAVAALLGLILFIYRRLSTKRIVMVTNKMDMLVYVVLLIQILSGLGVAYFVRWGSSWFASVLSPYLISIFAFSPKVELMANMPWLVQAHVVSAFIIVGIIPFTRFMHFLVAPIDYIWRRYQVVIWTWNHKSIRRNRAYITGKRPSNS